MFPLLPSVVRVTSKHPPAQELGDSDDSTTAESVERSRLFVFVNGQKIEVPYNATEVTFDQFVSFKGTTEKRSYTFKLD